MLSFNDSNLIPWTGSQIAPHALGLLIWSLLAWFLTPRRTRRPRARPSLAAKEVVDLWWHTPLQFVDVRRHSDFLRSHVSGAVSLAEDGDEQDWTNAFGRLLPELPVVIYGDPRCERFARQLAVTLRERGWYTVQQVEGGWDALCRSDLPLEGAPNDQNS